MIEGERDAVLGLQVFVLASLVSTAYLLTRSYVALALAFAIAALATVYLSRASVELMANINDDRLVPPNEYLVESIGITLASLGAIGYLQWHYGWFYESMVAVLLGIGVVWSLGIKFPDVLRTP